MKFLKYFGAIILVLCLASLAAFGQEVDSDGDGILDDGDSSGVVGDNPCTGGETENCDDNCLYDYNPDQDDSDGDGVGDACCCDLPGDVNNDGHVNILDIVCIIAYQYSINDCRPVCRDEGDPNGNCVISILDITFLIAYLYKGGPDPICGCAG